VLAVDATWYLETLRQGRVAHRARDARAALSGGPRPASDLAEATMGLSRRHAELSADISGRLRLTDLDSTNGTFVNRQRVNGSVLLADNDVIHFAMPSSASACAPAKTPPSSAARPPPTRTARCSCPPAAA
jgi:hypothetical protein